MKSKKNTHIFGLAALVILVVAVSFIIVGFVGQTGGSTGGDTAPAAIFEISGHTNVIEAGVTPESGTVGRLEADYGPLNIPRTVKRYDIVQFSSVEPEDPGVLIRGKEYALTLERMSFESIDDGIDSYSGKVGGYEDSVVLLTFAGNIVTGSVQFADETIFISPVQNRENAMKTEMPLHIVYSSKDMDRPGIFGGF